MRFLELETFESLPETGGNYSIAIFASGFEARSTHILKSIGVSRMDSIFVLEFGTDANQLSRKANDLLFRTVPIIEFCCMDGLNDDEVIYDLLDSAIGAKSSIKIFVDYSVMTRAWYGAILTWARMLEGAESVEIDFVYASGRYLNDFQPLQIEELASLPNFEGVSGGFRKTSALFGLGYDTYATLAVYDRIEPDILYCCIAGTDADDPSVAKVLRENKVILESCARVIELPLLDLAAAFRSLCNLVLSIGRDSHVVIVPMGPKPHVLVTLLVALRMPWLTCLHAKGARENPVQVEAAGPISVGRVTFVADVSNV